MGASGSGGEAGTPDDVDGGGGTGPTGSAGSAGVASSTGSVDPAHVFVRDPGGCACSVPSSAQSNSGMLALLGLALGGALGARRRRRTG
jgi:hypothetical protein